MPEGGRVRLLVVAPEVVGEKPLGWAHEFAGLSALAGVELRLVAADKATLDAVSAAMREPWDVVVWSGHGRPGGLAAVDGVVDGGWLAAQVGYCPPRVVVLAACYSANVALDGLSGLTHAVSEQGIDCIGMRHAVEDAAAIVFTRELVRAVAAGVGVSQGKRVAERMVRARYPNVGEIEFVPGLRNGTRAMAFRMKAVEDQVVALGGQMRGFDEKMDLVIRLVGGSAR